MKKGGSHKGPSPSQLIDVRIKELGDWRGKTLSRLRTLVREADPDVVEEWKWRGVPVWSHDGSVCTGETYKNVVKMTFARGAALNDPSGLFNASLGGTTRRAIDFHEGEKIDEQALKALVRAAVALNKSTGQELIRGHREPNPIPCFVSATFSPDLLPAGDRDVPENEPTTETRRHELHQSVLPASPKTTPRARSSPQAPAAPEVARYGDTPRASRRFAGTGQGSPHGRMI